METDKIKELTMEELGSGVGGVGNNGLKNKLELDKNKPIHVGNKVPDITTDSGSVIGPFFGDRR